jgi:hypothetical protein
MLNKINIVTTHYIFMYTNVKRVIAVARLCVAQPTYGTCPITCPWLSKLHLTAEYNNQCAAEIYVIHKPLIRTRANYMSNWLKVIKHITRITYPKYRLSKYMPHRIRAITKYPNLDYPWVRQMIVAICSNHTTPCDNPFFLLFF